MKQVTRGLEGNMPDCDVPVIVHKTRWGFRRSWELVEGSDELLQIHRRIYGKAGWKDGLLRRMKRNRDCKQERRSWWRSGET
jgi:hypothetical protein